MENVDIARLSASSESFLRVHSLTIKDPAKSVTLDHLMTFHAMSVVDMSSLLSDIYKLAWQSLRTVHSQVQISHQHNTHSSSLKRGREKDVDRNAPPDPGPEPPAAPPYVLTISTFQISLFSY